MDLGKIDRRKTISGGTMRWEEVEEKIHACLIGAAIGAELGFARVMKPEICRAETPDDLEKLNLSPLADYREEAGRVHFRKLLPLITLGISAYLDKKGRVVPEDFAQHLMNDAEIAGPVFYWDTFHTTQEILKEGMNPRISGLGNAPCGLICASMPAVGIYHLADPEYAYLDGVELASVTQPRLGADWAGLCAAAIAAAFIPDTCPEKISETVLKIAFENNKNVFYQLNSHNIAASVSLQAGQQKFAEWWFWRGGRLVPGRETNWVAYNPIWFVLPLLAGCNGDGRKMFSYLSGVPDSEYSFACHGFSVAHIVAGAIAGALNGKKAFPDQWLSWAQPIAERWFKISDIVRNRLKTERENARTIVRLVETRRPGSETFLEDKIRGCLLAGAIGNAMGSPVEGRFYWEIDKKYPKGITGILDPKRLEGEDDNQMGMHLVETYIERRGKPVMARHFGNTWKNRLNRDHFFALCMGNAYDLITNGWDPRITGHWSVVTGSTVMCMEPVGIYHMLDSEYAQIDATAISYMYQRGLDVMAAAILSAAVAEAFSPDASVESVCKAALKWAPAKPFRTFDRRPFKSPREYLGACLEIASRYTDVLAARKELYEKCLLYHAIDPLELLGFALAMFYIAKGDVRQAAIGGANIGRDSDTISGRAAMLAGSLKGASSIPEEWIALCSSESLERIRQNAKRLAMLVESNATNGRHSRFTLETTK